MIVSLDKLFVRASRISVRLRDAVVSTLYPTACRVCGEMVETRRDGVACGACWREVEHKKSGWDFCGKCWTRIGPSAAGALSPTTSGADAADRRCGECDSLPFGFVRSCGPYEGALRESVLRLKRQPDLPARLGEALRGTFAAMPESHLIESIIPVPLHPERLASRGFNQAEILARELAPLPAPLAWVGPRTGPRLELTAVIRVKKTERRRAGLSARERAASMENAFRVRAPRLVEGRVLLVVDDLMTTGGTAAELSRALIEAGASAVNVLTLARAMNEFSH
jgi:ComF family protein